MQRKFSFGLLILVVLFLTTGCISINKKEPVVSNYGGVFYSGDQAETWESSSDLLTPSEKPGTINATDVYFMKFDPNNPKMVYAGTKTAGLYYSRDGGIGWTRSDKLPAGFIRDLAVDEKNKCVLYSAVETRLYKSEDCALTWKSVWYSDSSEKLITALDIDWYNPWILYAGLSDGSLIKSVDGGKSWGLSNKFAQRVNKIVVDPNDSNIVYAGVLSTGLYRSDDKGGEWNSMKKAMKEFKKYSVYYDFDVSTSTSNTLFYASSFGLLKSTDKGETWSEAKILSQPGTERIFSLAIDPSNAKNIYYGTDRGFYKSVDGGTSWVVKKMPTTRVAGEILVFPDNSNKLLLGAKTNPYQ